MRKLYFSTVIFFLSYVALAQNYTILQNASTLPGCNCFQLTPDAEDRRGAIFQNNTISLNNSFDFSYDVFLGCNGSDGADGIVFVLTNNPNGLGSQGGSLGYGGGTQPFSIGVEFDTWPNGENGDPTSPAFDHIGIQSAGQMNHNIGPYVQAVPGQPIIDDCNWHTVRIVWNVNTNTMQVYFDGNLRQNVVIPNMVGAYFGGNPIVNWGWTGGTGGGQNLQQVCVRNISNWTAGVNYQSCSTTMQFSDVSTSSLGSVQSWAWTFGDGGTSSLQNPSHTYAAAGTYNVTLAVTDITGCTNTFSHPVTINPPITITPTLVQPLCNGAANGSISVVPSGGFGPSAGYGGYTYSWNGGVNTLANYSGIGAGTYAVTVTDGVCTSTASYLLDQPTQVTAAISHTDATCNQNNGTVSLVISGGTTPYQTITWPAYGLTGSPITGLSPSIYIPDFRDANGCSALLQYTATVAQLPCGYNLSTSSVDVSCFGGSNGSATLTVTGASVTNPVNISWTRGGNPVGNTATISNLIAGTYTYNWSDGNGQTFTGTVVVNQPGAAMVASMTTINTTCAGTNNGQALASVNSGGVSPYSYVWTPPQSNTASVSGLGAGNYTVTITDSRTCTATATGTVTGPPTLTLNITAVNDSCYQSGKGRATANPGGGTPPYTYYWNNISSAQTNLGLTAGTYNVIVTDDNGCTITQSTTITEPTLLTNTKASQNVLCNGGSTGSITITPSGGTPGYTYTWNPATATGNAPNSLGAGQYNVTVTDAMGCQKLDSVVITQPAAPLSVVMSHTDVRCFGGSDGTVTFTVSGGTPPYTYMGNPIPPGTTTLSNIPPSTYTGNLTDANGCTFAINETVSQPQPQSLTVTSTNNVCNGATTGTATANFVNATGAVNYVWSNTTQTGANITNLAANTYNVTATDANLCSLTGSTTVTEPTLLTNTKASQNVLCNGGNTGSITITPSGGTPGYTYTWNPATVTGNAPVNLGAGQYNVTITDAAGCQKLDNIIITQPAAPLSVVMSHTDVRCFGGSDGTVTFTVSGGTPPYTYMGNPIPPGTTTLSNIPPSTYTGNLTDANGCTFAINETVSQPQPQSLTVTSTNNLCSGATTGTATANFVNATGAVNYVWSNTTQTGANITNLAANTYNVTATDANQCSLTGSTTVTEPPAPVMSVTVVDATCFGGNGNATAVPQGAGTYTYVWSGTTATTVTVPLPAGNYTVTATDGNQCNQTAAFTINEPAGMNIGEQHTDVACNGDSTGTIQLTVTGGTGPNYTYVWNPNVSTSSLATLLPAGTYAITITDQANCSQTISVPIAEPALPLTLGIQSTNIPCFGQNNGTITLTATGGTPNYGYAWSPNVSTGNSATGLAPGGYTITVTDANGCSSMPIITISEPSQPLTLTTADTDLTCNQSADGTATVTVTGGTIPYTYAWTNGVSTTATATGLAAGTYTVTVTDDNLCTNTATYTINEPQAVTASAVATNVLCNGDATGTVTVTAGGGVPGYTYNWAPAVSTNNAATGLNAGAYSIIVTDTNGCTITTSATVNEPAALVATVSVQNVLCNGESTGSITVSTAGGVAPFAYTANDGANTYSSANGQFNNVAAGTYAIVVADNNACTVAATATVTEQNALTVLPDTTPVSCYLYTDGQIILTPQGGTPLYNFQFSNGEANTTGVLGGLAADMYSYTVTDANGCSLIDSIEITQPDSVIISVSPTPITVELGDALPLTTTTNQSGTVNYVWQPSFGLSCYDCPNPTFEGIYSQAYTVDAITAGGCTGRAEFIVTVTPDYNIFFPNAFSPNGDGMNEYWQFYTGSNAIKQIQVQVYNRIGEMVFEGNDLDFKWYGDYKGVNAPMGVYTYVAKIVWLNNHTDNSYHGTITLIR